MLLFLALSCLAAAALGSVAVYQRGAANRLAAPDGAARLPPKRMNEQKRAEATLETLQHGDVVLDGNDDYVVVGTIGYREEQDAWALYVLDAGATKKFLEVRRKAGTVSSTMFDAVADAPIHGHLGNGLTYRSKPLTVDARGDARTTVSGESDGRVPSLLKYARYTGPGSVLVVEEEGTSKRAYYGSPMPSDALTIYPHA